MCFGTFDIFHLGHLNLFQQAKKHGDYLIVVIARDETKRKLNKIPHFNEKERLEVINGLKIVDEAVLGYSDDLFRIIEEKNPDIICLGYDQSITEKELKAELKKRHLFPEIKPESKIISSMMGFRFS